MEKNLEIPQGVIRGFGSQFNMEWVERTEEAIRILWHVRQEDLNPAGIAHGGAAYSVADIACVLLGFDDLHVLTTNVNFYYHYPITVGDVSVHCRFNRKGSFTSLMEVELFQEDRLCMKGFFNISQMNEERV